MRRRVTTERDRGGAAKQRMGEIENKNCSNLQANSNRSVKTEEDYKKRLRQG